MKRNEIHVGRACLCHGERVRVLNRGVATRCESTGHRSGITGSFPAATEEDTNFEVQILSTGQKRKVKASELQPVEGDGIGQGVRYERARLSTMCGVRPSHL